MAPVRRKPLATHSGSTQSYATKIERGTARPIGLSLDDADRARLARLCAAWAEGGRPLTNSAAVRRAIREACERLGLEPT